MDESAVSTIQNAVNWALATANSPTHGYDQGGRWGPDYDCSSFVISAWDAAGVPVKRAGATYTGNMRAVFLRCGFRDVTSAVTLSTGAGLCPGDVLLNERRHAALYAGAGEMVQAGINEFGTAAGGQSGDQTDREICVKPYYDFPWNCALRYEGPAVAPSAGPGLPQGQVAGLPLLEIGSAGPAVQSAQVLLRARFGQTCGPYGADGQYGPDTARAVESMQAAWGLEADGIVGPLTWFKLIEA